MSDISYTIKTLDRLIASLEGTLKVAEGEESRLRDAGLDPYAIGVFVDALDKAILSGMTVLKSLHLMRSEPNPREDIQGYRDKP